jgi:hypothetical protein
MRLSLILSHTTSAMRPYSNSALSVATTGGALSRHEPIGRPLGGDGFLLELEPTFGGYLRRRDPGPEGCVNALRTGMLSAC